VSGYADPELLVSDWLKTRTGKKTWADPRLPHNYDFTAPIGHVQRGAGSGDTALSLDSVVLDIDWYAKVADHARVLAQQTWAEMRLNLPHYTWSNGVTVSGVSTLTAPFWAPDPSVFRRSATYRVILHGLVA
jgi:hypothetical protein